MDRKKTVCLALLVALSGSLAACGEEDTDRYQITAEYFPDKDLLACEMTVDIFNETETALDVLPFRLYPNVYSENGTPMSETYRSAVYYEGESYGKIEILSLKGAEYTIGEDGNILYAALEKPLYPSERVQLTFTFDVTLAHVNHRLGVGERAVTLGGFYPILCHWDNGFLECAATPLGDPFVSDLADYSVSLTVPAGYEVIGASSSGTREKWVYSSEAEGVREVSFVLGSSYRCLAKEADGIPVTYWYLEDGDAEGTLSAARESLSYYNKVFGKYTYPAYQVVQTDLPYGVEYPALILTSSALPKGEIRAAVAHGTAHQWWYAMVGSNQYTEAWQDEALSEFSAALFLEEGESGSYRECVRAAESSYRSYYSILSQVNGSADTRMSKPLTEFSGEYEYRNLTYAKGLILFDRLRDSFGEEKLLSALRAYAKAYRGKIASPADLAACLSQNGIPAEELIFSFTEGRCII